MDITKQRNLLGLRERLQRESWIRSQTPTLFMDKDNIKILYCRYADDWIILSNATRKVMNIIKQKIQEWLAYKVET